MKVIITDPLAKEGVEILKNAGLEVDEKTGLSPEELIKEIPAYDAIVIRSATKVTRPVIEAASNLKVIGRAGVGLDNVDREAAKEKGIAVLNTPAATSISVSELALGYMLCAARHIVTATVSMRESKWAKKQLKGTELYGKTLGIIGLGRIGTELAKRAMALGMELLILDPYLKECAFGNQCRMDEMLPQADYISLHLPHTDETHHLIGAKEFGQMKDGVVFVNCARGGIVDEDALYDACKSGKVACACVDVFEKEPLDDYKLFSLPNVIGSPHIGAQAKEGQLRAGTGIAEQVRDALMAKPS